MYKAEMSKLSNCVSAKTPRVPGCIEMLINQALLCASDAEENRTIYRIVEAEYYGPDDPYTHGNGVVAPQRAASGQFSASRSEDCSEVVCEQLGPPGCWYFHRAGKKANGKFKGGTFKGLQASR